jgi:hypothetical protein
MKSLKLSILIFVLFIMSCKNSDTKNDIVLVKNEDSVSANLIAKKKISDPNSTAIKKEKLKNFQGVWYSYKFIKDKRYNESFDDNYAAEVSRYASFSIKSDSLIVPNWCKTTIYEYKYATKIKNYNEESIFITYFKPKNDSLTFLSPYNANDLGCEKPYNVICFLKDELIIHDRGYFFFYKREKNKLTNNEFIINGIPGDNRNSWAVEKTYKNLDLNYAYEDFKKYFPFGGLNLKNEIPTSNYLDKTNNVDYEIRDKEVTIIKANPMGTVIINLSIKNGKLYLVYKMEYLDEG